MSEEITKHNLFRAARPKAETRADVTDRAARAIIDAETERREAKSARLKQARLEHEAEVAASRPPAKQRPAKAAGPRRGRSSA